MDLDIGIYINRSNWFLKACGWNDRILPNAIAYLISEQPTPRINRKIYLKEMYKKPTPPTGQTWWKISDNYNDEAQLLNTMCNQEKIEFLRHLIKKLR